MQIHDFNPGISANGVFWTVALPPSSVNVEFGAGKAAMRLNNFDIDDYFTLNNALSVQTGGPVVPPAPTDEVSASVSLAIEWRGVRDRFSIQNPAESFSGQFVLDDSSIHWTAQEAATADTPSFTFRSTSSSNVFSILGHEQNGRFFKS